MKCLTSSFSLKLNLVHVFPTIFLKCVCTLKTSWTHWKLVEHFLSWFQHTCVLWLFTKPMGYQLWPNNLWFTNIFLCLKLSNWLTKCYRKGILERYWSILETYCLATPDKTHTLTFLKKYPVFYVCNNFAYKLCLIMSLKHWVNF